MSRANELVQFVAEHGLRTPNEGINQRKLKIWADLADKISFGRTLKIWKWELIFGRAVKPGVRSLWSSSETGGQPWSVLKATTKVI